MSPSGRGRGPDDLLNKWPIIYKWIPAPQEVCSPVGHGVRWRYNIIVDSRYIGRYTTYILFLNYFQRGGAPKPRRRFEQHISVFPSWLRWAMPVRLPTGWAETWDSVSSCQFHHRRSSCSSGSGSDREVSTVRPSAAGCESGPSCRWAPQKCPWLLGTGRSCSDVRSPTGKNSKRIFCSMHRT